MARITTNHITGDNQQVDNSQTGGLPFKPIEPGTAVVINEDTGRGNVINDGDIDGDLIS